MTASALFATAGVGLALTTPAINHLSSITNGSPCCPSLGVNSTPSVAFNTVGTAGTIGNLSVSVATNTWATNVVFTVSQNNVSSGITVTYTSAQTGVKSDTTHTAAVAQGDTLHIIGATSTGASKSMVMQGICLTYTANSGTSTAFSSFDGTGVTLSGTGPITDFISFGGDLSGSTITENEAQFNMPIAGTAKYMQMNVTTNGRSTSTVVTFRKNSGAGSQTFTYTSGTTGNMVDTTHTDSISVGDKVCCSPALGTGTGNFIINAASFWFDGTTDGLSATVTAASEGLTQAVGGSVSAATFAGLLKTSATVTANRVTPGLAATASKMWVFIKTNGDTATANFRFQVAAANATQIVAVTALTTGAFQDTTHNDAFTNAQNVEMSFPTSTTAVFVVTAVSIRLLTAVTYSQAVSTNTTPVPSIARQTGKIQNTNSTPVPSIVRSTGKVQSTNTTPVPSIVRTTGKVIAVSETPIPSVVKSSTRALSTNTTPSPSIVRSTGKIISFAETPTPSIITQASERRTINVSTTPIPSITTTFIPGTSSNMPPHRGPMLTGKLKYINPVT